MSRVAIQGVHRTPPALPLRTAAKRKHTALALHLSIFDSTREATHGPRAASSPFISGVPGTAGRGLNRQILVYTNSGARVGEILRSRRSDERAPPQGPASGIVGAPLHALTSRPCWRARVPRLLRLLPARRDLRVVGRTGEGSRADRDPVRRRAPGAGRVRLAYLLFRPRHRPAGRPPARPHRYLEKPVG